MKQWETKGTEPSYCRCSEGRRGSQAEDGGTMLERADAQMRSRAEVGGQRAD